MARFRFKIVDSQGRRRSGVLRADSLDVAESALRAKLCQIEELSALTDDGQAVDVGRLESSFALADRIRYGVALILGCLCLVSLSVWWRTPAKAAVHEESDAKLEFAVKGSVQSDGFRSLLDGDLSEVKVHAVFPELPYEIEGRLAEDGESFELPLALVGRDRPKELFLEVTVNNDRWRVPEKFQVAAQGDTDVGLIRPLPPVRETLELVPPPLPTKAQAPPRDKKTRGERKREERQLIDDHMRRRPSRRRPNV